MSEQDKLIDSLKIEQIEKDPVDVRLEKRKSHLMSMGIDPNRMHPTRKLNLRPEQEEGFWDITREMAIDTALFVGAGAAASAVGLPTAAAVAVGAGVYGAAKFAQEKIEGDPEASITEAVSGKEFSPAGRALAHAGEGAMFMGAFKPAAKVIGGVTGKALKGVDLVTSGQLSKVSKKAEPYTDELMSFLVKVPEKMSFGGRNVREWMQPAVERLPGNVAATFRKSEVNKRLATGLTANLGKDISALGFEERNQVLRGLVDPDAPMFKRAKAVVDRFDDDIIEAKLDPMYDKHFREELAKSLNKSFPSDSEALHMLFDPSMKNITRGQWTDKMKHAFNDLLEDPGVSDDFKTVLKDLYSLPAVVPRNVYDASRTAQTKYLKEKLVNHRGLVSGKPKTGYEQTSHFKINKRNAYVPRDVKLQLDDMAKIEQYANTSGAKLLSMWKSGKTILRPAYHGRNTISNAILADWGGLPIYRVDIYARAIKEMKQGSTRWKEFIHSTGGLGTFTHDELNLLYGATQGAQNTMDIAWKMYRKVVGGYKYSPAKIQNAEENMFKFAKYIHSTTERGMSKAEAILDAQKYLMNYGEASVGAAWLRSGMGAMSLMPFSTWYTKVIPLAIDTAVKHPFRFFKWLGFAGALQNQAIDEVGITDAEWEGIEGNMPEWMKSGFTILMPWRDSEDRLNLFNGTFLMPGIGDFAELYNLLNFTSAGGLQVHNPIISLMGSMMTKTKSSGAPLYFDWEKPGVKMAKVGSYALEQLSPAMTPFGGTDYKGLMRTINEEQGAPTVGQAVLSSMGLKMQPINPAELARKKRVIDKIHHREWMSQFKKDMRKAKSAKDKKKIMDDYRETRQHMLVD